MALGHTAAPPAGSGSSLGARAATIGVALFVVGIALLYSGPQTKTPVAQMDVAGSSEQVKQVGIIQPPGVVSDSPSGNNDDAKSPGDQTDSPEVTPVSPSAPSGDNGSEDNTWKEHDRHQERIRNVEHQQSNETATPTTTPPLTKTTSGAGRATQLEDADQLYGHLPPCPAVSQPNCQKLNCGTHPLNPCFGPTDCGCPAPQCIVIGLDPSKGCVKSPFWIPPVDKIDGRFAIEDGRCNADRGSDEPPINGTELWNAALPFDDVPGEEPVKPRGFRTEPSNAFPDNAVDMANHLRGTLNTLFGWFPYAGAGLSEMTCDKPSRDNNQPSFAEESAGVYHFTNVCPRAYSGITSVYPGSWGVPKHGLEFGSPEFIQAFVRWISKPSAADSAGDGACLYDLPVFFMPVAHPADNHMHVFTRIATAIQFLHNKFGPDFRKKVMVIYYVVAKSRERLKGVNAHHTFYRLLSERYMIFEERGRGANDAFACFKDAYAIAYTYPKRPVPGDTPGYPPTFINTPALFPLFGQRTQTHRDSAEVIRNTFADCFGSPRRRAPNTERPKLLILWRSRMRRFAGFAALLPQIAELWKRLGGGTVRMIEHLDHTPSELIGLYAGADVVAGMIGTALLWGMMMPPGSVMVEFARSYGCVEERGRPGWNMNSVCEYGGLSYAFGFQHLTVLSPRKKGDPADEMRWEYTPLSLWESALTAAICRLRNATADCELEGVPDHKNKGDPLTMDERTALMVS